MITPTAGSQFGSRIRPLVPLVKGGFSIGYRPRRKISRPDFHSFISESKPSFCTSAQCLSVESTEKDVTATVPDLAFAFDIDGVLLRKSTPVPRAKKALQHLSANCIPFVLLTNGGGKLEADRVADLSKKLGVPITIQNFIQGHTPFSSFHHLKGSASVPEEAVLVLGGDNAGDNCRRVAESYGYTNVVTGADLYTAEPGLWPFGGHMKDFYAQHARPLPAPIYKPDSYQTPSSGDPKNDWMADPSRLDKHLRISAIIVFNDPRDWGLDLSLIVDLLLSHRGYLGTCSPLNGNRNLPNWGYLQDRQPPLIFSHADFLWPTDWHLPRFGIGGFREALEGVWARLTSGDTGCDPAGGRRGRHSNGKEHSLVSLPSQKVELKKEVWGKPSQLTYEFAESVLQNWRRKILGDDLASRVPLRRVYMIGDNPESDIRGANEFQSPHSTQWLSLLVKTGLYQHPAKYDKAERDPNHKEAALAAVAATSSTPTCRPTAIVDDAFEAVEWAMSHSKR